MSGEFDGKESDHSREDHHEQEYGLFRLSVWEGADAIEMRADGEDPLA